MGLKIDQWDLIHLATYARKMGMSYEHEIRRLRAKYSKCTDDSEKSILLAWIERCDTEIKYHDLKHDCFINAMDKNTREFYFACC